MKLQNEGREGRGGVYVPFQAHPIHFGLASSKIAVVFEYCGGAVKLNLKDEYL